MAAIDRRAKRSRKVAAVERRRQSHLIPYLGVGQNGPCLLI
jgi:hypothetical protein